MAKAPAKFTPPVKLYDVRLTGDLEGVALTMRGMTAGDLIRLRTGEMSDADAVEWVLAHVVSHNLDVESLLDLDAPIATAIIGAWGDAIKDAAVPPASATS